MSEKSKLAFGFGYDPEKLRGGVHLTNCFARPHLGENMILCEFEPKLSYRALKPLGDLMDYGISRGWNELQKGATEVKNDHFITNGDAKDVIKDINDGIIKLFEKYEPDTDWEV